MRNLPTVAQVQAELCRRNFYEFVQYFWDTIIAEAPVWNWHIKYLCDEMQGIGERVKLRLPKEYDYYIFNVPPGSSKSTIISIMYPLWCWTNDPTQRFICGSFASTPAEDIAEKCFNLYTSDKFTLLYPHLNSKRSGGKTWFKNGLLGERYTTSTGSAITGVHAHQKILDDPMSPAVASSQTERESTNKWVSETISSRNVDKNITVTIIVQQRLHEEDTTGYILKKKGLRVKHISIPAEITDKVKPIPASLESFYIDGLFDPIRSSRASLNLAKIDLGSYGYSGQMLQLPSPPDGGVLKKAWFPIVGREKIPWHLPVHFQIDGAYTEKQKNDPSAGMAYITNGQFVWILNSISVMKEFPDLCKWIVDWVKQYRYNHQSKIYVEPKASGKSVVQQIKQTTKLNIIEDESPKEDKLTRVNAASPKIEAGRVFLLEGHWNESFLDQSTAFPNGAHDDEVDNLSAVVRRELNTENSQWVIW